MLNRTIQPPIKTIHEIPLPQPEKIILSNGIPVYIVNMGTQDVMKMQVVFSAGRPFEHKQMVSRVTSKMLKEGTGSYNSAQIAEMVDFYGATINMPTSLDFSSMIYYSMTKHFPALIGLATELLTLPTFPDRELNTFRKNAKRNLQVDLTKNDVVAYRKVTELIFGENHPYGYNSDKDKYDAINKEDLVEHFKKNFHAQNCTIFLSGKVDDSIIQLMDQHLGQIPSGKTPSPVFPNLKDAKPQKIHEYLPDSLQKAIRIGKKIVNRQHEDYGGFMVLNTVFGGYFGSRLMTNIREDKGYTYNIYSVQDTMQYDGCFYISTEVGNEFLKPALKEIYKEMKKLQNDLVGEEELTMVKNYILGNMLNMVDGPFKVVDVIKTLVLEEKEHTYFQELVDVVQSISATEIRDLAQKYFDKKSMWEVVI